MHVYQRYARHVLRHGSLLESTANAVEPGMVLTSLEGVDWGDQPGVVVDVDKSEGATVVTVFLTNTKQTKRYKVPSDSAFQSRIPDDPADDGPATSVDVLRMNEPIPEIHRLPDSYWPYQDPNHPNAMQDALWRPTLRKSPVYRYYTAGELWHVDDVDNMPWNKWNARLHTCSEDGHPELRYHRTTVEGWTDCWNVLCTHRDGISHDFGCAETPEEGIAAWNEHVRKTAGVTAMKRTRDPRRAELRTDPRGFNPPKPDVFVPKVDEDGKPIMPIYPDLIGYDIDPYEPNVLADAALDFYQAYQTWRDDIGTQYILPAHQNAEVSEFSIVYADRYGIDRQAMDVLWRYMVEIGMWPHTEYDAWLVQRGEDLLNENRWDDLA